MEFVAPTQKMRGYISPAVPKDMLDATREDEHGTRIPILSAHARRAVRLALADESKTHLFGEVRGDLGGTPGIFMRDGSLPPLRNQ